MSTRLLVAYITLHSTRQGNSTKRTSALLQSNHPLRHINTFGWLIRQAPAPSFGSRNSATFERSCTGE